MSVCSQTIYLRQGLPPASGRFSNLLQDYCAATARGHALTCPLYLLQLCHPAARHVDGQSVQRDLHPLCWRDGVRHYTEREVLRAQLRVIAAGSSAGKHV